jgi:hypothetical protein
MFLPSVSNISFLRIAFTKLLNPDLHEVRLAGSCQYALPHPAVRDESLLGDAPG